MAERQGRNGSVSTGSRKTMDPKQKNQVKNDFKKVIKKARGDMKEQLAGDLQTEAFFMDQRNQKLLSQRTRKGQNILHIIADEFDDEDTDSKNVTLKLLVQGIIQKFPSMLGSPDNDHKTPLHSAIEEEREILVRWMCEACTNLCTVLGKTDQRGGNCLHAAVQSELPIDLVRGLISASTEEMLGIQDSSGYTPLHLAVDYENCRKQQLQLVQLLIERGDRALDIESHPPKRLSIYQHHKYTREAFEVQRKAESGRQQDHESKRPPKREADKQQPAASTNGMDGHKEDRKPPPEQLPARRPTKGGEIPITKATGEVQHGHPDVSNSTYDSSQEPSTADSTAKERESSADEIQEFIKLHYLRTRSPEKAATWLYSKNPDSIQTAFDHFEAESGDKAVNAKEFMQIFEQFQFDQTLQLVHFRDVCLSGYDNLSFADEKNTAFQPMGPKQGRADMKFFFDWLWYSKGVRRILKVIVEESKEAHSDEAIEECLAKFNVETLDWRKVDICPMVIRHVGGNLRELFLRWSGNNAVLRGWSESEGLALCPVLRTIHVQFDTAARLSSRSSQQLSDFKARLKQLKASSKDNIEVDYEHDPGTEIVTTPKYQLPSSSSATDSGRQGNTHRWLECIDHFADKIRGVKLDFDPSDFPGVSLDTKLSRDVIVAVIDDGIDISNKMLRHKVIGGTSFDTGTRSHFRASIHDHGTIMACMIVRVCPRVKIYAIKVQTSATEGGLQIDVTSAANAIQAAVDRDVDIISMSWSVNRPEESTEQRKMFDNALKNAANKGIIMVCSSSDKGKLEDPVSYPGAYSEEKIIKIGAATALGQRHDETPELNSIRYILPGHEVFERKPKGAKADKYTGSSVATALAAGLAGLVFHCVRLGAIYTLTTDTAERRPKIHIVEKDYQNTRSPSKASKYMMDSFDAFGVNNAKFVEVWTLLERDSTVDENWKRWNAKERLAAIAEIGQEFVNRRREK